jgi:hypothetical protein
MKVFFNFCSICVKPPRFACAAEWSLCCRPHDSASNIQVWWAQLWTPCLIDQHSDWSKNLLSSTLQRWGNPEDWIFHFFHIPDGIMYSYRYHVTNGDNSKPTDKATLQITSWLSRVNSFIYFKSFHWFIS